MKQKLLLILILLMASGGVVNAKDFVTRYAYLVEESDSADGYNPIKNIHFDYATRKISFDDTFATNALVGVWRRYSVKFIPRYGSGKFKKVTIKEWSEYGTPIARFGQELLNWLTGSGTSIGSPHDADVSYYYGKTNDHGKNLHAHYGHNCSDGEWGGSLYSGTPWNFLFVKDEIKYMDKGGHREFLISEDYLNYLMTYNIHDFRIFVMLDYMDPMTGRWEKANYDEAHFIEGYWSDYIYIDEYDNNWYYSLYNTSFNTWCDVTLPYCGIKKDMSKMFLWSDGYHAILDGNDKINIMASIYSGHPLNYNILKSTDQGKSWEQVQTGYIPLDKAKKGYDLRYTEVTPNAEETGKSYGPGVLYKVVCQPNVILSDGSMPKAVKATFDFIKYMYPVTYITDSDEGSPTSPKRVRQKRVNYHSVGDNVITNYANSSSVGVKSVVHTDVKHTNKGDGTTDLSVTVPAGSVVIEETKPTFWVNFYDYDGTIIKSEAVKCGKSATPPADPVHDNMKFQKWSRSVDNITEPTSVFAQYAPYIYGGTLSESFIHTSSYPEFANSATKAMYGDRITTCLDIKADYQFVIRATSILEGNQKVQATGEVISRDVAKNGTSVVNVFKVDDTKRFLKTYSFYNDVYCSGVGSSMTNCFNMELYYPLTVKAVDTDLVVVTKEGSFDVEANNSTVVPVQFQDTVYVYQKEGAHDCIEMELDGSKLNGNGGMDGRNEFGVHWVLGSGKPSELTVTRPTRTVTFEVIGLPDTGMGRNVLTKKTVLCGGTVEFPDDPQDPKYPDDTYFDYWEDETNSVKADLGAVHEDLFVVAMFQDKPKPATYTVKFVDYDGTVLSTQKVTAGEGATDPMEFDSDFPAICSEVKVVPGREGYMFIGWDESFDCVTGDMTITAQYEFSQELEDAIKSVPENVNVETDDVTGAKTQKVLYKGRIYIINRDHTYDTNGAVIK